MAPSVITCEQGTSESGNFGAIPSRVFDLKAEALELSPMVVDEGVGTGERAKKARMDPGKIARGLAKLSSAASAR